MSLKKTNKVNTETVNRKQFESQSLMSGSIFTVYKPRPVGIQAGIVGDQLFINSTRTIGGEHHNTVATISNSNQTSNNISMNELNAEDNSAYFLTLAKRNLVKLNQQAANSSVGATQGAPGASKKNLKLPFKHYCISKDSNSLVMSISMENIHDSLKKKSSNPAAELIIKTAQAINSYIDNIERTKYTKQKPLHLSQHQIYLQQQQHQQQQQLQQRRPAGFNKLRPLNLVTTEGPTIDDCIGIYRDSMNQNDSKLRELYEHKLRQLKEKNQASGMDAAPTNPISTSSFSMAHKP